MLDQAINGLLTFAEIHGLIHKEDKRYLRNQLLWVMQLDSTDPNAEAMTGSLLDILSVLTNDACKRGVAMDTTNGRDLFDTRLMGVLTPWPRQVIDAFWNAYCISPEKATEYFHNFSCATNYIRTDRIAKDVRWLACTPYGELDITINLSKPEKDPRDIAAAKGRVQTGYPSCLLCFENEGYAGRIDHPARQNHRIIPLDICGQEWGLQYSPYAYYNEHCIVMNSRHVPMKIDNMVFDKLLSFIHQFPHYFVGSNADLPIVGGSILTHEHFQGGQYTFAMAKAPVEKEFIIPGYESVKVGIVRWPMSVIRLNSKDAGQLSHLSAKILEKWRSWTDERAFIFAETDGIPHNTITPIARMRNDAYEIDLVLRNNITTYEHPMGVFHPHEQLHHIKKENIGLIEVMGLAVLPSRLKKEMLLLKDAILSKQNISAIPEIEKHAPWANEWLEARQPVTADNIDSIIQEEIGKVFLQVLVDAGVYKRTQEGQKAFIRFIQSIE